VSDAPPTDGQTEPAPTEPAVATQPTENANGTSWDLVKKMKAEGATREEVLVKLKALDLDEESAKVLLNSVMGPIPSEIPGAQLTGGTNTLAPSVFTISDFGLTGPPHVVGLYWMGFGAAILVALGIGFLMTSSDLVKLPEDVDFYAVRLGGVASMTCIAWGMFRYSQGVIVRRK
jgi:hypothetical protein